MSNHEARAELARRLQEFQEQLPALIDKAREKVKHTTLEDINAQLEEMGCPYVATVDPNDPECLLFFDRQPVKVIRMTLQITEEPKP